MFTKRDKPWWVDEFGTRASLLSALSTSIFGVASISIAVFAGLLQAQIAEDSNKDRDNTNISKFSETLTREGPRFDKSYRCHAAFIEYINENKHTELNLEKDRDSLYRIFSQQLNNPDRELDRNICLKGDKSGFLADFFFSLNTLENGLANWSTAMKPERKINYYKQLYVLTCTDYTYVKRIFEQYDDKVKNIFVKGFANIPSFIDECEAAEKYLGNQINIRVSKRTKKP